MNTKKLIIFGVLGLIGAALGVTLPSLLGLNKTSATAAAEGGHGDGHTEAAESQGSDSHAADSHGGGGHGAAGGKADPMAAEGYLLFDRMVLNRMTRD